MKDGEKLKTRRSPRTNGFVDIPVLMTVVHCPSCGNEVDLWSGDDETRCAACECTIYRKQRALH